ETLRARKVRNQVKEVKVKLIVYNINKKVIQLLWIKLRISTEPVILAFLYNL
ncbi:MAG: IS5/IS1182 family transposase, partial [Methanosarcina flavescens]